MANARQQLLADLRKSSKIRLLAPVQTGIASLAKQNASNETDIMVSKYNAGQVGNQQMLDFLTKQASNSYLSPADKLDIQNKIRDFSSLIKKDSLEAAYKAAPDNSLAQVQAAKALAQFYNDRASTMEAGTPAQSQALQNAGDWNNTVVSIQKNVNKLQRNNLEQSLLQKINQQPTSSSQRSQAQVDMYKQLYDMAVSQGDTADAQVYAAKAEQANTMMQQYQEAEAAAGDKQAQQQEKKSIVDTINTILNAYHDGKLSENDVFQAFQSENIDTRINTLGDTALMLSFNRTVDTVQKNLDKGGLHRGTTSTGLPTVLGKGSGTGGSTSWDQQDYKLNNALELTSRFLKDGKTPDGKAYTPQDYKNDVANIVDAKATLVDQRITDLEAIAAQNPNTKVVFNGKKARVADVLDALYKEQQDIQPQSDAVNAGTFAIMEVAPSQFTKAGAYKTSGKSTPDYQVIDTNNIPPELKNLLVVDDQGIYHQAYRKPIEISKDQFDPYDPSMSYDKNTGKYYKLSDQLSVDLYQQGKSKVGASVDVTPGQPIQSLESIQSAAEQAWQDAAQKTAAAKKAALTAPVQVPDLTPKPSLVQQANQAIQGAVKTVAPKVQEAVQNVEKTVAPVIAPAVQGVQRVIQPAVDTVSKVVAPVVPVLQKSPIQAAHDFINPPSITPSTNSGLMPITKVVNGVNSVKQYNPTTGFNYVPITPPKQPAPTPTPKPPNIGTMLAGAAGQAFNKVKSLFGF